jgi:hypothetical protein
MPPGKGRYIVGGKGTHGCKGYPVVGGEGKVHGCHTTRASAMRQQAAIYASQNQQKLADAILELAKSEDLIEGLDSQLLIEFDYDMEQEVEKMDEVSKKDYSSQERRQMARTGKAMPDGSFPIANRADLSNAIQSVGRAANYAAARRHIISRARELNALEMLPEDWNAKKNLSSSLFKNMPNHAKKSNTTGNGEAPFNFNKG